MQSKERYGVRTRFSTFDVDPRGAIRFRAPFASTLQKTCTQRDNQGFPALCMHIKYNANLILHRVEGTIIQLII